MKKTYIIAIGIMLFLCSHLSAQNQYYFRVGDTIHGRDTIYHYQWWSENWLSSNPMHHLNISNLVNDTLLQGGRANILCFDPYDGNGVVLRYCYTEQPLKIVGIASSCYSSAQWDGSGIPFAPVDEPPFYTEYLELYDADTGRTPFPRVAQVEWDYTRPNRYMAIDYRIARFNLPEDCCTLVPHDSVKYIPIKEFYFDKPITVYDSFYIGHTTNSVKDMLLPSICIEKPFNYNGNNFLHYAIGYDPKLPGLHNVECDYSSCNYPAIHLYKYRYIQYLYPGPQQEIPCDTDYVASRWQWGVSPHFMLDFPIIEIDSSFYDGPPQYVCPSVENFRVGNEGEGSVVLLWHNHNDHLRWEISYGPQGLAPEDGTQLIAAIPAIQIANLDSCTHYSAYIRAVCMHDSLHYSEWSEPLDIFLCDTGGAAAIEVPLLDQLTYLMPNPAAEQVEVLSSYGMTRVVAYSLQGTKMADLQVRGLGAALDVAGWPEGMYIVVIHTPAGNVTKKLVVGR